MAEDNAVQLGFALPLNQNNANDDESGSGCSPEDLGHRSPRWSDWDGGKIGGTPSWLNPRDLPSTTLRCRGPCSEEEGKQGTSLRFVTQLYCPADDVTENDAAFHRSLYVFACPTCCSTQPSSANVDEDGSSAASARHLSSCIRVLRCQLPKQNDFYPTTGNGQNNSSTKEWTKHTSQYWAESTKNDKLNLCAVCGQRSKGKCPKQNKWFCGPDHQKECLKASKLQEKELNDANGDDVISLKYLPSVCYESELVVEEEPAITEAGGSTDCTADASNANSKGTLFQSKDITDADADLEQSDLNALTGNTSLAEAATGVTDPTTLAFYARMAIGGKENDVRDQCLRYCRWPEKETGDASKATTQSSDEANDDEDNNAGPLWLSSNNRPTDSAMTSFPPPCQYCGAPRAFEFQILPQMLHYLLQNPESTNADGDENNEAPRQILTESERALLLEAKSKIESGMELPEGFKEQHEAAVANAREALLGINSKGSGKATNDNTPGGITKGGLDWGTIAVYTCTASCGNGGVVSGENGAYMEEAAFMQPPLD